MRSKTNRSNSSLDVHTFVLKYGKKLSVIEENTPIFGSREIVYCWEIKDLNNKISLYPGMSECFDGLKIKTDGRVLCTGRPFIHRNDNLDAALKTCKDAICRIYYVEVGCARKLEKQLIWKYKDAGYTLLNKLIYKNKCK